MVPAATMGALGYGYMWWKVWEHVLLKVSILFIIQLVIPNYDVFNFRSASLKLCVFLCDA